MASDGTGTNDVSVAFAGVNRTILEFADAVSAADVLVSTREPSSDAASERKLARPFLSRHSIAKAQVSLVVRAQTTAYSVRNARASRVHELERADRIDSVYAIERLGGDRVGFFNLWPGHCIPGNYLPSH